LRTSSNFVDLFCYGPTDMSRVDRFLTRLNEGVLVCDGAMGTELYKHGIPFEHCFDELTLSRPDVVLRIHAEYRAAGADILVTNTFGATEYRLGEHGFADKLFTINERAGQLARAVAGDDVFVAGSIGPLGKRLAPIGRMTLAQAEAAFARQVEGLAAGGVDLLLLETFSDLREISAAMAAAKKVAPDIPVVAQMTFTDEAKTVHGFKPEEFARALSVAGAVAVGANCSVGPQPLFDVIERMLRVPDVKLTCQPNAGMPQYYNGRYVYLSSPEYIAQCAAQFVNNGCHIVGGCCGTSPEHVREIRKAVQGMTPSRPVLSTVLEVVEPENPTPFFSMEEDREDLEDKLKAGRFVSSVEIDPPKGINTGKLRRGAELCKGAGVDLINIADSPLARARMSPMALANIIRAEVDIEIILHMSCRDRNVIGLQSEVMGAYAQGVRNILAVTGDPPQVGDYPNATGVFDVDAIGLTTLTTRLNSGVDLSGRKIKYHTDVFIGVASNPTSDHLETEVERFKRKQEAGAHYTMTQPIYELDSLERFLDMTKPEIPMLVGILPLRNARHASFLHNEVPGMFIPQEIRDRMEAAGEDGPKEGVAIAQEFLAKVKPYVQGVYLMPPFNQFWMGVEVLKAL